jgi:hypothetical protein
MRGEKTIGRDTEGNLIYKYSKNLTTDQYGHLDIPDLEWDTYTISVSPTAGYDIMESCPPQPVNLLPAGSVATNLTLITHTQNSFLVLVKDGEGIPLQGATVRLFNQTIGYDKTIASSSCGQAFFNSLTERNDYSLQVAKEGYQNYLLEDVSISGQDNLAVVLNRP